MFYAHFVLSKKGPFSRIWLAAHWDKKLTRAHVFETNINSSVEAILEPKLKMALRTSGHLLLGVVRIYSRKAKYLLADCNEIYVKIKTSFRPGVVDLPDESNREAALAAITLPENIQDYEATMADLTAINLSAMAINLSRPEDITMNEEVCDINLGRQDDDFGDAAFEELPSKELLRDGGASVYDSVYGRATDASGRFSVRDSDRPSIRPEIDGNDTLIGGDSRHDDKLSKDIHPSMVDDMNLDDDTFPDYGPDSNGSFGGDIDHNLFNSPNLFEDPSAHKQLDQISSEFDTHVEDLDLRVDVIKEGHVEKDRTGNQHITNIAADVLALHDQQQNGPLQHEGSEQQPGQTPLHQAFHSMTPMHTINTTLIANESEAFALQPIDMTATISEPRRVAKRKRRLIIDESKSIPSELMKIQMQETMEITTQLDLAPPTKRLMHMKETGGLDKLFTLPGRTIPSRLLQRLFTRNLHSHLPLPEEAQEDVSSISAIYRPVNASMSSMEQLELTSSGAVTPRDLLRTPSSGFPTGFHLTTTDVGAENHAGLDAIPEGIEELDVTISGDRSRFPTASAEMHSNYRLPPTTQQSPAHHDEHPIHDPFLAVSTRPTDIPEHHSVTAASDDMDDDNNDHGFSLIDMHPASVLSETHHEMLEQELAANNVHSHAVDLGINVPLDDDDDDADNYGDNDYEPTEPSMVEAVDEAEDILEERRLEKRSKDMLRRLRAHTAVHGWGDNGLSLAAMCEGNNKKQAASKFYTALLLRKQGSILLTQGAPFTDIRVLRGPNFIGSGVPNFEP